MSLNLVTLLYLFASVCFIQALKGLSHPTTSIRGNLFGMIGMGVAMVTTAALIFKLAGQMGQNGASGLTCVQYLHGWDPEVLIVVLTGYASIATAVEAIKLGACHYLAKPANTDDIEAAFARKQGDAEVEVTERQTASIKTLEWERIHEVLAETDFNISETARRLGMHRRTLARKLEKQRIK